MTTERDRLIAELLRSKGYREAFWEEAISTGVAVQIREMREAQEITQAELGEAAGMAQERIHKVEDPDYARWTTGTLKRIARALGVVLEIRFVSYGEFVDRTLNLTPEILNPPAFDSDPAMTPRRPLFTDAEMLNLLAEHTAVATGTTTPQRIRVADGTNVIPFPETGTRFEPLSAIR